MHEIPIGQVWPLADILNRRQLIEDAGLTWSVVESIPVHESIKTGKPDLKTGQSRQHFINNYKQSIINMSKAGLDILCYNFMPVVDWTRTDLEFEYSDGSNALKFDFDQFAAFDLFMMRRKNAENDYSEEQIARAHNIYEEMTEVGKNKLIDTVIKGLPGRTSEAYTMTTFIDAVSVSIVFKAHGYYGNCFLFKPCISRLMMTYRWKKSGKISSVLFVKSPPSPNHTEFSWPFILMILQLLSWDCLELFQLHLMFVKY